MALREIFVTAYLSLKVKFLLKSSFRNIISEPYISPTEKRKPFFPLSLLFPTAFNHNLNWFLIINFNQFWFYNQLNDTKHNLNWFHFNISHFIMNKHYLETTPSIILIDFTLIFPILEWINTKWRQKLAFLYTFSEKKCLLKSSFKFSKILLSWRWFTTT